MAKYKHRPVPSAASTPYGESEVEGAAPASTAVEAAPSVTDKEVIVEVREIYEVVQHLAVKAAALSRKYAQTGDHFKHARFSNIENAIGHFRASLYNELTNF